MILKGSGTRLHVIMFWETSTSKVFICLSLHLTFFVFQIWNFNKEDSQVKKYVQKIDKRKVFISRDIYMYMSVIKQKMLIKQIFVPKSVTFLKNMKQNLFVNDHFNQKPFKTIRTLSTRVAYTMYDLMKIHKNITYHLLSHTHLKSGWPSHFNCCTY